MKVPIQYKSSDRYNAGVDVIYDDDSKLQYAPFIYASTQSGDNGPDEGGDEEGEDSMVIKYDTENSRYDKTWQEVYDAVNAGKTVFYAQEDSESGDMTLYYVVGVIPNDADAPADYKYEVSLATIGYTESGGTPRMLLIACATASDYLVNIQQNG